MKGAESEFKYSQDQIGILLLHGFLGNPAEMKYVGEKLFEIGYTISIPRYPGHGTSLKEMIKTSTSDWVIFARESLIELQSKCKIVYIVGLSMGGLITLLLAKEFNIKKIVLMSVPTAIPSKIIYFVPFLSRFIKILPKPKSNKGINSPEARDKHVCYDDGLPVRQTWELHCLIKKTIKSLSEVYSETLIMQSTGDEVIPKNSADLLYSNLGSKKKQIIWFQKSNHVISVDYDKDQVAKEIIDFFGMNS
ncbi:MAG: alpha/beta fold hydrolase [Leptospiraceae bacterium]|nr:alpha/beta fold hydrolase [Leptospiraceae bacterium]